MGSLQAKNIEKFYGNKKVIHDISIEINSGEIVGLLGPNGAGKTTMFYIICGLLKSSKGEIFINDDDISNMPFFERAEMGIGYLPQEACIFRDLSVEDNLNIAAEISIQNKTLRHKKIEEVLSIFKIEPIRKALGSSVSGGERRRVEIARMMISNPEFLLFDEPFAGIDPVSVHDIKDVIKGLSKDNIGMLITDHSVRDILDLCDRVYVVRNGYIIVNGTTEDVLNNEIVKEHYLGDDFNL